MSKQISPVENGSAPDNVTSIEDWRSLRPEAVSFERQTVHLNSYRVHAGDSSRYDVHVFEPGFQQYDSAVAFATPWFTDLEGFNDRLGASLARRGMTAVIISPERLTLSSFRHLKHFGELRHDATAIFDILDELEGPTHDLQVERGKTIIAGYSRGSMIGLGINEMAGWRGREIPYNYFVDPCLEHAVSLADVEQDGAVVYVGKEVRSLFRSLRHSTPQEWGDIPKTISGALKHFAGNLAVTPHIFSGEAGKFDPPRDMTALMHMYVHSSLNHREAWETKFKNYPNVRFKFLDGYHLSGSNPVVRHETADSLQKIQKLLADHASPAELLDAV